MGAGIGHVTSWSVHASCLELALSQHIPRSLMIVVKFCCAAQTPASHAGSGASAGPPAMALCKRLLGVLCRLSAAQLS